MRPLVAGSFRVKGTVAPVEDGLKVSLLNKPDLERSHWKLKSWLTSLFEK
jgi:hypothetical protein